MTGRKRALLIGTEFYQDASSFAALPCTRADTEALRKVLSDPAIGQFDEVLVLNDPSAAQMRGQISRFLDDLADDDLGLLYVSGHGARLAHTTGEFIFIAADTVNSALEQTGVGATFVNEQLEQCLAGRKVAIFDCCYSGGFTLGFRTQHTKSAGSGATLPQPRGVHLMASSGVNELSWVDQRSSAGTPLSLFTAELVEALRTGKGDTGGDGIVSVDELFYYVNDKVRQVPSRSPQVPVLSTDKVTGRIDLARCSAGSPLPAGTRVTQTAALPVVDKGMRNSWDGLFDYYRACLDTITTRMPLLSVSELHERYVCLPGHERLLSRDFDASGSMPLTSDAADLIEKAADAELWSGYPAVVLLKDKTGKPYRIPRFAPLFITRVAVRNDRLEPYGEIRPHQQLIMELLPADKAKALLDTYRSCWQASMHGQMIREIQYFLREELQLDAVQELRPTSLESSVDVRTPNSGARNAAILFLVEQESRANTGLLKDLDEIGRAKNTISQTALAALAGDTGILDHPSWRPVTPLALNDAQRTVLESAMTRRLTVATGPPGTGKSQLVANVVATAVANGQTVLVTSTNNRAVDEVWKRVAPGALIRTGSKSGEIDYREAERQTVTGLLSRPPSVTNDETARAELWCAARDLDQVHSAIAEKALLEHDLLRIAEARQTLAGRLGGKPDQIRTYFASMNFVAVAEHAKRASKAKLFGSLRRTRFCRQFSWTGDRSASSCAAIAAWAGNEVAWDNTRTAMARMPADSTLDRSLNEHRERVCESSTRLLDTSVGTNAQAGRLAIESLLKATSMNKPWSEIRRALQYLRGWAVTNLSIRRFPPAPGLFDLVIVDEASQCSIPQVIPALYRAKRALIIGDAMQLTHLAEIKPAQEAVIRRDNGIDANWLEDQRLSYHRHSAFHALSTAAGGAVLLDEHYRCHPEIAALVNKKFYANQLTVLTDVNKQRRAPGETIRWSQVKGSAVRDAKGKWRNPTEAEQVKTEVETLLRELPEGSDIGVVTPFAGQAALLTSYWRDDHRVQVGTVHTFQGGERDAIVLSLSADESMPRWTKAWLATQRNLWNVAITRARSHLVLVGDRDTWRDLGDIGEVLITAVGPADNQPQGTDSLALRLYERLIEDPRNQVTLYEMSNGYLADAVVRANSERAPVLLDRAHFGRSTPGQHLRLQFDRARLLGATRIPAWRLFDNTPL